MSILIHSDGNPYNPANKIIVYQQQAYSELRESVRKEITDILVVLIGGNPE